MELGFKYRWTLAWQYSFFYDELCNLALYSLNAKKFGLADAMISAAVDEVDVTILAEMNRFKTLRIKNSLFSLSPRQSRSCAAAG